ncbi:hypothetical protein LXL04_009731 [Taraxacum kok-saghyz]
MSNKKSNQPIRNYRCINCKGEEDFCQTTGVRDSELRLNTYGAVCYARTESDIRPRTESDSRPRTESDIRPRTKHLGLRTESDIRGQFSVCDFFGRTESDAKSRTESVVRVRRTLSNAQTTDRVRGPSLSLQSEPYANSPYSVGRDDPVALGKRANVGSSENNYQN